MGSQLDTKDRCIRAACKGVPTDENGGILTDGLLHLPFYPPA